MFEVRASSLKQVEDARQGEEGEVIHALVGELLDLACPVEHWAALRHVLLDLLRDVLRVGGYVS